MNKLNIKIFHFFIKVPNFIFINIRSFIYLKSIKLFLKKKNSKNINFLSLLIVIIILFLIILFIAKLQKDNKIIGYIIALFLQFAISLFLMTVFISISVDRRIKKRKGIAFVTNILFPLTTTILLFNNTYSINIIYQIFNFIILLLMLLFMKKCIKIKKGDDISYLKEMNHLCVALFTVFILFYDYGNKGINNDSLKQYINFYYLFPFMLLKSLYESLERKGKQYKLNNID
jgi:hypothetical protein